MDRYCKRLIEVDLPIKRISAHARREKSIRHGHISTLHIWWARRPLAACRAVICASLWPDPADELCPDAFRKTAVKLMKEWAEKHMKLITSQESLNRFIQIQKNPEKLKDNVFLRQALLDFIADFANWDNSTVKEYLETSRALTQTAHESLGGAPGTRPLVVDPFCGGGSIPLEALRVGADAFASDLNPIPVLLNKVVLEYIPKYGQRLADEVRKWGEWIKKEAEKELAEFYPKGTDGATPIAYLWARTIQCEGPGCGAEVPLIRSLWLAKKTNRSVALQLLPDLEAKCVNFQIIVKQRDGWVNQNDLNEKIISPKFDGTVKRGSATCPSCGYTTPVVRVRAQLKVRRGGANDARLMCVVTIRRNEVGRFYRLPLILDAKSQKKAADQAAKLAKDRISNMSRLPDEPTPEADSHRAVASARLYGMSDFGTLFTARQLTALDTFRRLIAEVAERTSGIADFNFRVAVHSCLALCVSKEADLTNSLVRWKPDAECPVNLFARQAIPMVWEFAETVATCESSGSWESMYQRTADSIEALICDFQGSSTAQVCDATEHALPNDAASAFFTDPPYYDSVPYAEISDFFYVWLKRSLHDTHRDLFQIAVTPKKEQAIVWHPNSSTERQSFEGKMKMAMSEGRRVLSPSGIGIVVFAHKSTSGWESQLQAMTDAGWIITASWPVDTECGSRMNAMNTASLASSVHLVCRPRENPGGSVSTDEVGDWRDVLSELPRRIHEWMPRLADEGVVGADAIFACLGPALEIFSRYSRVEKASGEAVPLKEYLEQVWAAVAKEALNMIFEGADTSGFEEDARLTAMWLWTLRTNTGNGDDPDEEDQDDDDEKTIKVSGYSLEYDAARKISQGLGAHLENLKHLVEIKGDTATLLSAGSRVSYLFGKDAEEAPKGRKKKEDKQMQLFQDQIKKIEEEPGGISGQLSGRPGETVLDQLHQSMLLFGSGRGEALKRFLVEDGVGRNPLYWRLAQSLSALYPAGTDEKRWVDGVLARKKSLGF